MWRSHLSLSTTGRNLGVGSGQANSIAFWHAIWDEQVAYRADMCQRTFTTSPFLYALTIALGTSVALRDGIAVSDSGERCQQNSRAKLGVRSKRENLKVSKKR